MFFERKFELSRLLLFNGVLYPLISCAVLYLIKVAAEDNTDFVQEHWISVDEGSEDRLCNHINTATACLHPPKSTIIHIS